MSYGRVLNKLKLIIELSPFINPDLLYGHYVGHFFFLQKFLFDLSLYKIVS